MVFYNLVAFGYWTHGRLGQGIYYGNLNLSSNSDDFIDSAQLLPYPPSNMVTPISISMTEFHFALVYKDRVAAICNLNDALTYEEMIPLVSRFQTSGDVQQ